MKAIKILYVHSSDEMYGADFSLLQLVIRLDQSAFEPVVVLPNDISYDGLLSKALAKHGIRVLKTRVAILRRKYLTPLGLLIYLWRLIISTLYLTSFIRREKIDMVHTNTIAVIPSGLAAWLTGRPHIWHIREIIVRPQLLWRFTSWTVSRLATRIIVNSIHTQDHLCAGNQRNQPKTSVVYNGIDIERFDAAKGQGKQVRAEWGIASEQLLIGMVGRVSYWKGQDYFLRVAQLVAIQHPEARFALVGGAAPGQEDYFNGLQSIVEDLDLENVVILSDYRTDIAAVIDAYDIFVLPSTQPEPFGNVILEAMAMSKPVVANAHGGCVEIVVDEVTGILVSPEHPNEMANAINQLLEDPIKRQKMGENGRKRLEKHFLVDVYAKQCQDIYKAFIPELRS